MKTRPDGVHEYLFLYIMTKLTYFFRSFQKNFGLWPKTTPASQRWLKIKHVFRLLKDTGVCLWILNYCDAI